MTNEDVKDEVSAIKKEISSLKRSSRFIDYYKARDFFRYLYGIRDSIVDLSKKHPKEAFILMKKFVESHESVMDRCDDSDGIISESYVDACDEFGEIGKLADVSIDEAVDLVFEMFTENSYGMYDHVIRSFKDVLKNDGLELLKSRFLSRLSESEIEAQTAEKKKYLDSQRMMDFKTRKVITFSLEDCKEKVIKDISRNIENGLREIADCRSDVDAYIQACVFPKTSYNYDDFRDSDKKRIASRLLNQKRASEVLEWLNEMEEDSWDSEPIKLRIAALELLNRTEEAQQERISWFNLTLSHSIFREIMEHATPQFREEFQKEAIKTIFNSDRVSTALDFFVQRKFIDECSILVQSKVDSLSEESYYSVRPAAKMLRDKHPLSATLLYRKMIDCIAGKGESKYYDYAVKDLLTCEELSKKIDDYKCFKSHGEYFADFQEKHKRKSETEEDIV
ncbi:MAG: hypothetical protein LBJ96_03385 [Holosporaceae bacterium]|jgi:hypothetical protein|nr:hypothetical protein [Holosporaceae bacterium]